MDRQETLTLLQLQRGAKIVGVRFTQVGRDGSRYPSKQYPFKSAFPLTPGALVVVEASDGFKVGTIDQVGLNYSTLEDNGFSLGELRHVVGQVDLARHASIKMEERHLVEVIMQAERAEKMRTLTDSPVFQALMNTPTPAITGVAFTANGTPHDPQTGEVIA